MAQKAGQKHLSCIALIRKKGERIGTVGWRAKYSEPCRPFSSPVTPRMRMERAGRLGSVANARATSIAAETPEASSPAPL